MRASKRDTRGAAGEARARYHRPGRRGPRPPRRTRAPDIPRMATPTRSRHVVLGVALAAYVLSFFHRTAPAAIAGELSQAFSIGGAALGALAATYFYVYTVLQVPVGVLADTLGPRRLLAAGSGIAAAGSLLFALAPAWELAAVGRTLVGVGVAGAFIATLKLASVWIPPQRFATFAGVTLFAGNLGAVAAGAPLAWIVAQASWRGVFVALGALSALLALAAWWWVRDQPQADAGREREAALPASPASASPAVSASPAAPASPAASAPAPAAPVRWTRALAHVLANPATWPAFLVNVGVGGSYFAFAGLWAVPYLQQAHGMTRVQAAQHSSLMLLGVAFGSLAIGLISDRLGSRLGVMRSAACLYAASWAPWLLGAHWPAWATLAWCFGMGLLIPGFTLSWTMAKEANPPEFAGIATAVVNVGIFLGTALLQPLVGWVLDRQAPVVGADRAWGAAIACLAGAALLGAAMTLASRNPKWAPPRPA